MTFRRLGAGYALLVSGALPFFACGTSGPSGSGGSGGDGAAAAGGSGATGGTGATGGGVQAGGSGGTGTGGTGLPSTGGASNATGGAGAAVGGTSAGMTATGGQAGSSTQSMAGRSNGRGGRSSAGANTTGGTPGTGAGGSAGTGNMAGAPAAGGMSAGCNSANTTSPCGTKGTTCSLDVAGTARTYYVQLPKNYSASTPYRLIFQYHPWGGNADQALTMYGLNSGIPDAIYVTPQGLDAGGMGAGWANTNGQDIAFTKAMFDDVQGKYCVDNSRIFSVGFSYGGMMSFALGCEMSNVFRAIAPMSGALYSDPSCKGTGGPIAMWGSHGTSDTVVPIDNGRAARDKILQENHCGTTTTPVDPSPCVKYEGCDPGYDVTWCEWDGPHGIPSFGKSAITAFLLQF